MEIQKGDLMTTKQVLMHFGRSININAPDYEEKSKRPIGLIQFEIAMDAIEKRRDLITAIIPKHMWLEIAPNYEVSNAETGIPTIKPRPNNKIVVTPFDQMPNHLMCIIGDGNMTAWKLDVTTNNITKVDLNVNADSDIVEELDIATTDVNGLHDYPRDTTLTVYKAQGASSNETLYKQGDYAFTTPFTPVGCVVTEKQIEALRYDVYFNLELEPYKTAFQKVGEIKIKDSKHAAKIRQIIELKKNLIVKELADLKIELQHKQGIFDHYVYLKAEGHLTK